jgi:hypothetical protein
MLSHATLLHPTKEGIVAYKCTSHLPNIQIMKQNKSYFQIKSWCDVGIKVKDLGIGLARHK